MGLLRRPRCYPAQLRIGVIRAHRVISLYPAASRSLQGAHGILIMPPMVLRPWCSSMRKSPCAFGNSRINPPRRHLGDPVRPQSFGALLDDWARSVSGANPVPSGFEWYTRHERRSWHLAVSATLSDQHG